MFAAALTAWKLTRSKLGEPWRQTLRRTRRRRLDTGLAVRHFFNALYLCPYTRQPRLHRVSFPQSEGSAAAMTQRSYPQDLVATGYRPPKSVPLFTVLQTRVAPAIAQRLTRL